MARRHRCFYMEPSIITIPLEHWHHLSHVFFPICFPYLVDPRRPHLDGWSERLRLQATTEELDFSETPVVPSGSVAAIIARTVPGEDWIEVIDDIYCLFIYISILNEYIYIYIYVILAFCFFYGNYLSFIGLDCCKCSLFMCIYIYIACIFVYFSVFGNPPIIPKPQFGGEYHIYIYIWCYYCFPTMR